jgi:NTP pyrophosphatase (non-canonical NTP hydrolase)
MSAEFDKERYAELVKQMAASWASGDHKNAVRVMREIRAERQRQDEKWGEQNHDDTWWLAILMEEVGELAQAMLHSRFGGPHAGTERTELTQVAAVAVQWLEAMGRRANINRCPACGDDRAGKGSLISAVNGGQAFCNEVCYEQWQQSVVDEAQNP